MMANKAFMDVECPAVDRHDEMLNHNTDFDDCLWLTEDISKDLSNEIPESILHAWDSSLLGRRQRN